MRLNFILENLKQKPDAIFQL